MYDCLVLSAGGTYGAAYIGAYRALEARSLTAGIRRFHGTSAGSLVATMAACGLTSAEMMRVMEVVTTRPRPRVGLQDVARLTVEYGAIDARDYLSDAMDAFLPPCATFATLAKERGVNLSVHAYNVHERRVADFGLDATPDADVRDAVAASCCVPFLFKPVAIAGVQYVDGAVAQRTPMHMVIDPKATLALDVRDGSAGAPRDVLHYAAILTSAASRHVDKFQGDFVTIEVPPESPGVLDLPASVAALDQLVQRGFDVLDALLGAK
jgi:NTE family protein